MEDTKRAYLQKLIDEKREAVQRAVKDVEPFEFGHAFLWGYVTVMQKSGNPKTFKVCLGSVCAADLPEACRLAETVEGVKDVWYNLD